MAGWSTSGFTMLLLLVVSWWNGGCAAAAGDCQVTDGVVNLAVSAVRPRWAYLEWQHAPSAATCADHYAVAWCVLPSRWSTRCEPISRDVPLSTASYNVTGLLPCSIYRIAISTMNNGTVQAQVADVIITPSEGLGLVQNLDVTVTGDQFAVIWDPPAGAEACTSRYDVCWWRQPDGNKSCSWATPNVWMGGAPVRCASYGFSVTAVDVDNTTSEQANTSYSTGAGSVQNLTASGVTPHSVLLSWNSTASSASCVAGYTITWCSVDAYSGACNEPATALNITKNSTWHNVVGLRPCHQHHFIVTVVNDDGSESDAATVDVKTSLAEFRAPQEVNVTVINSQLTFVDFTPAEDSGLCTSNYTGCLWEDDNPRASQVCLPAPNSQYWANWDHHTLPCTNYTLQLTASGDNHTASTSVSFTSGSADASDLHVTNVTSNSSTVLARLTWEVSPRNRKCVHYQQVTWAVEGRGEWHEANVTISSREFVLEGLEPCTRYEVGVEQRVAASSAAITTVFHSGSNVTSATDLAVAGSKLDSLTVSFTAPRASPACVSNYSVCWRRAGVVDDHHPWHCGEVAAKGASSIVIDALQPCTNYTVNVTPLGPDSRPYRTVSITAATTGCQASRAAAALLPTASAIAAWIIVQMVVRTSATSRL